MGSRTWVFALCVVSTAGGIGACAAGQAQSDSPFDAGQSGMDVISNPMPDASTDQAAVPDSSSPVTDTGSGSMLEATAPEAGESETSVPEAGVPDTSMVVDTGVPETSTNVCVPTPGNDTLPFAVDTQGKYITSGWEGDMSSLMMPVDPTCSGNRSSASAQGNCHPVIYTPTPVGTGGALGWVGVLWQHPMNNWGTSAGYPLPAGATKVSFWARGKLGGEIVSFSAGFAVTPSPTAPCFDDVAGSLPNQVLTTTWTHYTMPLSTPNYGPGVIVPFGFTLAAAGQPVRDAGTADAAADASVPPPSPVSFFIDDIEWQQ